jgi:hypothetical protein
MKLILNAKNPRLVEDENGNLLFEFLGLHLSDLKDILTKVNGYEYPKQI